jgi:hypothetical protein
MWEYSQSSGVLQRGSYAAVGYSGAEPDGKNNPAMQSVHNVGPIPQGQWTIVGPPVDLVPEGPYVLRLEPQPSTITFGRSGFLIHGDTTPPGNASQGCIIMPRPTRQAIWASEDYQLNVTG